MLKTKFVEIEMTSSKRVNFYNNKGYDCKKGDIVKIDVKDLSKYDKTFKLIMACDKCGKEKEITNASYWNRYGNNEPYYCKKCIKNNLNKRKCEICGSTHNVSDYLNKGQLLCSRHRGQMRKYGYIKRTCNDPNEIRILGDYAEFDTYDNKTGEVNGTFKIDLDMVDFIRTHKCHKRYCGYACCHIKDENGNDKKVRLHRVVLGLENDKRKDIVIDHINRDKSDNRRCNLRLVSAETNNRNVGMYSHNTSGVKGVSWNKQYNKWEVYIHQHNKKINLGLYNDLKYATKVREIAEIIYFGKDSPRYEELINKYIDELKVKEFLLNKKR